MPIPDPPFVTAVTDISRRRPRSLSAYAYGNLDLLENLQLIVGATVDSIAGGGFDQTRLSPKLGLVWTPTAETTVRAGAMQTLQPPTFSRQDIQPSLEPTSVAGFNQFFFGSEAEEATRYGLGIDHRFSDATFVGAEISRREIDLPYVNIVPPDFLPVSKTAQVEETSGRAYLYRTLAENVALGAGYEYDKFANDPEFFPEGFLTVEMNRFLLQGSYFHPSGIFAGLSTTYAYERGRFQDNAPPFEFFSDSDDGAVVDAVIGYRLPRRYGVLRLEARNVFDRQFSFQDVDPQNPRISPERLILLRLTVSN
jgi:outer membrane receptor protein involved in Fe transport